ncbi:hypothetical protein [Paractinoplanes rishiriensis]|uniref:Uncharacterized protein n=1 Tax=Paractinoplanes rishiriensis TaxID=1050105 RepID=A0A919JXA3_9ACTN|nr:hypothetical protein [Actinoplanes rishiriensis]GIE94818.1 hypothetical protein Ari01nite_22830 [Actinoplanes rishiriensis]
MTNAVIYVQADRFHANAARCLDYCSTMRYQVAGLVCGDWAAAVRMVDNGLAAVIVVPSLTDQDPATQPRIEVAPKRTNRRRPTRRPRNASRLAAR